MIATMVFTGQVDLNIEGAEDMGCAKAWTINKIEKIIKEAENTDEIFKKLNLRMTLVEEKL